MSIQQYLDEMKTVQQNLLDFLEDETNDAGIQTNLFSYIENQKINEDKHKFASLLHLILKISINHHHTPNFFSRIEMILQQFKDQIKKQFSNTEIFNIFKRNKRILLFLIEEKMIIFDKYIYKNIISEKFSKYYYKQYFYPEIQKFLNQSNAKLVEDFYKKRKIGENDGYICQLIQRDSVEEFIAYVNRNNYSLNSSIKPSIYETNPFLIKYKPIIINQNYGWGNRNVANNNRNVDNDGLTLIKYAAFFGSIQIFKYLQMSGVKLTPSLWLYVIHSKNAELIHLLEENHVLPYDQTYKECFLESIKCHHNDIAFYFQNNFVHNVTQNDIILNSIRYYNFAFMQNNIIDGNLFFYLVQYDYFILLLNIIENENINTIRKTYNIEIIFF